MTGESIILVMKIVTVMKIGLDAIIGEIKSFLEKTTDSNGPGVMPPSPQGVGLPGWRELIHCSDDCSDKQFIEVTVHMVHNEWIHAFLCRSHPENIRGFPPYYLFRDEAGRGIYCVNLQKNIKRIVYDRVGCIPS